MTTAVTARAIVEACDAAILKALQTGAPPVASFTIDGGLTTTLRGMDEIQRVRQHYETIARSASGRQRTLARFRGDD